MRKISLGNLELLATSHGSLAHATLNRPQALNALTLPMIRGLAAALQEWENDNEVQAIILQGAGRAFCAGGDIKAAYAEGQRALKGENDGALIARYYGEEYQLDRLLFHYRKPLVAFMNGITMGGGFGIAGSCRFRVATENTVFAMPEVGIGFFPDIGAGYYLNQCPDQLGRYLALTGNSIGPADMLIAGLATHYMPSSVWAKCEARLAQGIDVAEVLAEFSVMPDEAGSVFDMHRVTIEECFAQATIQEILAALVEDGSAFAHETTMTIFSRSPTSVLVTLEHLHRALAEDFDTVIARDFGLAQHFLRNHDFYEGVRAAVIDKDRQPRWRPSKLADVSESDIAAYFAPARWQLDDFAIQDDD